MDKQRLDVKLTALYPEYSRSIIHGLLLDNKVKINGKVITDKNYKVKETDKITLSKPKINKKPIDLKIIYEDENCVVVDKPSGILSHAKGGLVNESTVADWLKPKTTGFDDSNRDGIVHRLDRATSGVMICAKNPESQKWLQKQFSTRKVKKTYIALIENTIDPVEAIIDIPIERNPSQPARFRAHKNGKSALTEYKVINNFDSSKHNFSTLELMPKTGRTHQLRVHLNYLKRPIVGDKFYGGIGADRLYLHAEKLELTLPDKNRMVFESPLPNNFLNPKLES